MNKAEARLRSPSPLNGEKTPRTETSRVEVLNRSSRREEALTSLGRNRMSLLKSAATRFRGSLHLQLLHAHWDHEPVRTGPQRSRCFTGSSGQADGLSQRSLFATLKRRERRGPGVRFMESGISLTVLDFKTSM